MIRSICGNRVLFAISGGDPPTLQEPERWSNDFLDVIRRCLQKDPEERPNTNQLLEHPFFTRKIDPNIILQMVQEIRHIKMMKSVNEEIKEIEDSQHYFAHLRGETLSEAEADLLQKFSERFVVDKLDGSLHHRVNDNEETGSDTEESNTSGSTEVEDVESDDLRKKLNNLNINFE